MRIYWFISKIILKLLYIVTLVAIARKKDEL